MLGFINKISAPLASVTSAISTITSSYYADRIIKTSQLCYIAIRGVVSVAVCIPVMYFKNKVSDIKLVSWKDIFGITCMVEVPLFLEEYCMLKALKKSPALAASIMNTFPLFNITIENFVPKIKYKLSDSGTLILDKGVHTNLKYILKDVLWSLSYLGSIALIYLDRRADEEQNSEDAILNTLFYASATAMCTATYCRFTSKYGKKYDADIVTYVSTVFGLPLRIAASAIGYLTMPSTSLKHDFEDNSSDLGPAFGLSILYLFSIYSGNYSLTHMKHISDSSMLYVITSNIYSSFLDKSFSSAYSISGLALSILSCIGIIENNAGKDDEINNDKKFIHLVADKIGAISLEQIKDNIINEWEHCKNFYEIINVDKRKLDMEYNEVLLAIISKTSLVNFFIKDSDGSIKLIISNKDIRAESIIIEVNFALDDEFNNKLISISDDTIELSSLPLDEESIPMLGEGLGEL